MNKIKAERIMANMHQADLAQRLGVKRDTVRAWETGARQVPSDAVKSMAVLFGVTADWLLGLSETRSTNTGSWTG